MLFAALILTITVIFFLAPIVMNGKWRTGKRENQIFQYSGHRCSSLHYRHALVFLPCPQRLDLTSQNVLYWMMLRLATFQDMFVEPSTRMCLNVSLFYLLTILSQIFFVEATYNYLNKFKTHKGNIGDRDCMAALGHFSDPQWIK